MNGERLIQHHPSPHDHPEHPGGSERGHALKRLRLAFLISASVMLLEFWGGWMSQSLALIADAIHMLADNVALGMALFAAWAADRFHSRNQSYGYYRLEVLAALANGLLLFGMAIFIFSEAWDRWNYPHEVDAKIMFAVGLVGLLANLSLIYIMHGSHRHNLNIRAVFFHVIGDALSSVAVLTGSALILFFQWAWADTLASLVVGVMIVIMSVRLLVEAGHVLLEGTPRHMNPAQIEDELKNKFPQIVGIHDFHIWEITSHLFAMTAHIEAQIKSLEDSRRLIDGINSWLRDKYGIGHTTFQVEASSDLKS